MVIFPLYSIRIPLKLIKSPFSIPCSIPFSGRPKIVISNGCFVTSWPARSWAFMGPFQGTLEAYEELKDAKGFLDWAKQQGLAIGVPGPRPGGQLAKFCMDSYWVGFKEDWE